MAMIKFINPLAVLLALSLTSPAFAAEPVQEEAIEGAPEVFFLGENLSGAIRGKICDTCPDVQLRITSDTEAYVDRKRVDLKSMAQTSDKPYLTFYDVKTRKVTRMYWRSR